MTTVKKRKTVGSPRRRPLWPASPPPIPTSEVDETATLQGLAEAGSPCDAEASLCVVPDPERGAEPYLAQPTRGARSARRSGST